MAAHTGAVGRWTTRILGLAWIGLAGLWVAIAAWALRVGEAVAVTWEVLAMLHLLLLAAWPILGVGLAMRRWRLVAAAVATIGAQLVVVWPMIPWSSGYTGPGTEVSIASLNAYVDNPSLDDAAREVRAARPDILVVQEFTPSTMVAFEQVGLTATYEHHIELPADTTGTAVYSRYPLREVVAPVDLADQMLVDVELPDGTTLRVANVHVFADDVGAWYHGLRALDGELEEFDDRWIALGDFNATFDHRPYRDLLRSGRRDAHLETGRGAARSWPADLPGPPLVLIDHAILSPGVRARSTSERTISGTDHRMIEVDLVMTPRGGA